MSSTSYVTLSLDELHQILLASYSGWFPDDDVSEESDNWKRLRTNALAWSGGQYQLDVLYDDLLPDTATGDRQDRWGDILNCPRLKATSAKKANALRCFGTAGSTVTLNAELVHKDGTRYKVSAAEVIPALATYVDVDVIAIDTGSITRKNKGEVLTFTAPPAGIEATAELQLAIDEDGADRELDGDYRVRLLEKIAQPGMGGNANDYKVWAKEVDGIHEAFVYSTRGGLGSVHLAAFHLGSGAARALSGAERTALKAYIDAKKPVSVADFVVLETVPESSDIDVGIIPEDGAAYAFDWDSVASPRTVNTWTGASRTLKLNADRPADMAIGDRVTWKSAIAPFHDGSEAVIEAFTGNPDEVVLRAPNVSLGEYDWTLTPPVAGNPVYSGGPLVAPLRAAIKKLTDSLGPARGAYAALIWVGTLYTSQLFKVVQLTTGVLDSILYSPVANVAPSDSPPAPSIGYFTPRTIIVRKA